MAKAKKKEYKFVNVKVDETKEKPVLIPFEELVSGHKFKVVSLGTQDPFWCAFCGGRGKNYVEIVRDDGKKLLVGKNCVRRVGLLPEVIPEDAVPVDAFKKNNEPVGKTEKESVLDEEIQNLLKDL